MMGADHRLAAIRRWLLGISAFLFVGTIGELIMLKHYDGTMQLLPFALCAIGFLGVALLSLARSPRLVLGTRVVMILIAASSLIGVWEHIEGNTGFEKELHPHATTTELVKAALTGRDPLMAPGILAVAALIAIVASVAVSEERRPSHQPQVISRIAPSEAGYRR